MQDKFQNEVWHFFQKIKICNLYYNFLTKDTQYQHKKQKTDKKLFTIFNKFDITKMKSKEKGEKEKWQK